MKRKILFIVLMFACTLLNVKAQDTIVGWTFPTGTATDANPDHHDTNNTLMLITTQGGTSAIAWNKFGVETYAAQATGWNGGVNLKYWQIEVNTTGYNNLLLSSMQSAGGANPGPRDWKAQYKVGSSGSWTDIPGTNLVNANDWVSAVLHNVSIPAACNNQASVFIRWIMTSDTSIAPPALVMTTGTTKIDSIFVFGTQIPTSVGENQELTIDIFPNPASDFITLSSDGNFKQIEIYNCNGILIKSVTEIQKTIDFDLSDFSKGIYFFRIIADGNKKPVIKKIVVL